MRSNDGSLRGKVGKVDFDALPEQSAKHDKKMFVIQDNLYGNTRMTDEQFAYSYVKRAGNISLMGKDMHWMAVQSLRNRADALGLPQMGLAGTGNIDVEEKVRVFESIVSKGDTYSAAAKRLKMSVDRIKAICEKLDVRPYGAIGMSEKVFKKLYRRCGRSKQTVSYMTGLPCLVVGRKCRELNI